MEERSKLDFNDVFNTLQQNLLDMGLRNNLLNFKEVARTVPIVDVEIMDLYDSLVLNKKKLSFLPKSSSKDYELNDCQFEFYIQEVILKLIQD